MSIEILQCLNLKIFLSSTSIIMIIQRPSIEFTDDGRLYVSWITTEKVEGIQIAVAHDSQFIQNVVQFVLPENASTCVLNIGRGSWYIRIGGWSGHDMKGIVKWSGILGPFHLESSIDPIQPLQNKKTIIKSKELENGYRLIDGKSEKKLYVIELSTDTMFLASNTKNFYLQDIGIGEVDVVGLLPETSYSLRYSILNEVPTDCMIMIPKGNTIEGVKAKVIKYRTPDIRASSDRTQMKSDLRILEEIKSKPTVRFSSYAEYIRYISAKSIH